MNLGVTQREMLSSIISAKGYGFDEFMGVHPGEPFPIWKVDALCGWINDEFLTNGLREDWEPNEYGVELEALLDAVNRLRYQR